MAAAGALGSRHTNRHALSIPIGSKPAGLRCKLHIFTAPGNLCGITEAFFRVSQAQEVIAKSVSAAAKKNSDVQIEYTYASKFAAAKAFLKQC